jgi:cellulose synthase/poly-beta-1,6-N-acetylglucosamine synthase-like glycosyltransferase
LITLEAGKHGKKHALEAGIEKARGKLIVTTDADCAHGPNWLRSIALFYTRKKPKLIIGPVKMKGKGFFEQFQSLEFLSLVASGAGAAGLGRPIMCNGANLAYEKDAFNELDDAFQMNEYSGDDVFLLHRMKAKYKKDISFLKSEDAMVFTESPPTLKAFFKQRTRWASKSKSYKDADTIIISLLVLLINLSIILSFTAAFFEQQALRYAVILFTSKFLSDLILLTVSSKFYKSTHLLSLYFLWAPVYPLYIVVAASYTIFSWFLKKR